MAVVGRIAMNEPSLVVTSFVTAVCEQDIDSLSACLHPQVRLRALLPGDAVVRVGPHAVAERFEAWLGGWDESAVLRSDVWQVAGRVAIAYRLAMRDHTGAAAEIEHQLYCDLLCRRFRVIDLLSVGPAAPGLAIR
jgi:hypothetical protein